MKPLQIYQVDFFTKAMHAIGLVIFVSIVYFFLLYNTDNSYYYLLYLGVGIYIAIAKFPIIQVYSDQILIKRGSQIENCAFNSGDFQIIEKKGLASLTVSWKVTHIAGIIYTPHDTSQKKIAFGWLFPKEDVRQIFNYIQKQQSITQASTTASSTIQF